MPFDVNINDKKKFYLFSEIESKIEDITDEINDDDNDNNNNNNHNDTTSVDTNSKNNITTTINDYDYENINNTTINNEITSILTFVTDYTLLKKEINHIYPELSSANNIIYNLVYNQLRDMNMLHKYRPCKFIDKESIIMKKVYVIDKRVNLLSKSSLNKYKYSKFKIPVERIKRKVSTKNSRNVHKTNE